jgi:ATP-dependent protease ClpP protease subunit
MIIEYNNMSTLPYNTIKDAEPIVIKVNKFDETAVSDMEKGFKEASLRGQEVIPVHIDSYGGQIYSLNAMISLIRSSSIPVATYVSGKAMSCGLILWSMGTKGLRFASPHSTGMLHEVSAGAIGKVAEIESSVEEAKRLNDEIFSQMGVYCKTNRYYFFDLMKEARNADIFLNAEELLKHGIVDHIKTPKVEYTVKTKVDIIF